MGELTVLFLFCVQPNASRGRWEQNEIFIKLPDNLYRSSTRPQTPPHTNCRSSFGVVLVLLKYRFSARYAGGGLPRQIR